MGKELLIGKHAIQKPVVLGAMSMNIGKAVLAAEVANCGGLGIIGGAGLGYPEFMEENGMSFDEANREALRYEIRKARRLTNGKIGTNILYAVRDFEGLFRVALEEGVDVFTCGAGLAEDLPRIAGEFPNTALVPIVSSPIFAEKICHLWKKNYARLPDAIIIEGPSAGGHLGFSEKGLNASNRALEVAIPRVRRFLDNEGLKIPLIAAGGIWTPQDLQDFIVLGADAGQMATRFVATFECSAGDAFKQVYMEAGERGFDIIKSPVGMLARAVRTNFSEKVSRGEEIKGMCVHHCLRECIFRNTGNTFCILEALTAARSDDINIVENFGIVLAGDNAGKATVIVSAKNIMDEFTGFL